jgi:general transcription factor 3C polypeptide 5 (transcription factor C subunit 1)
MRTNYLVHNLENNSPLPSQPPSSAQLLTETQQFVLDQLKILYEQRPIWTQRGMKDQCPAAAGHFKFILKQIAYCVTRGPYRGCFIKYGYDPRKELEAKVYQTIDIRQVKSRHSELQTKQTHIFDGKTLVDTTVIQICDIIDPDIKSFIDSTKLIRKSYDVSILLFMIFRQKWVGIIPSSLLL